MRIGEGANTSLVVVASHDEVYLRFRSRVSSMASEHDQLVQIPVALLIVAQRCHSQLQQRH